jgi:phage terminase small subunit
MQMPVLSNSRWERFANLLLEGLTAVDAYEKAGYKRNDGNASTLANHPEVQARLKELKGKLTAKAVVTAESLLDEAEQVRLGAMEYKQFNAANTAIKGKAVLTGHWVERAEIGKPGEFDALTDDELERMLIEKIKVLGLNTDAESDPQH